MGYGGGMGYGMMGGGYGSNGAGGYSQSGYQPYVGNSSLANVPALTGGVGAPGSDQTGSYLGAAPMAYQGANMPHIIPNPFDNTLLIQGTPQQWDQISKLIGQLDVPPRQVLIEAKIYELDLNGAFSSGLAAYLQQRGAGSDATKGIGRTLVASLEGGTTALSAGMLVGKSRELLGVLNLQESTGRAKVISAPSVIATDSVAASINVGQDVPTLSSQAVAPGVQQGGTSLFTNTIQNRSTGVTLQIMARVNSSGIVTMVINQDVSAPIPPPAGVTVNSTSFSKRSVQTQVTVQDGDTIAIGGIIQDASTESSAGIPVLHRIPILGAAFGSKSYSRTRTELIIFLTPRVIYDTNQMTEATEDLVDQLKKVKSW